MTFSLSNTAQEKGWLATSVLGLLVIFFFANQFNHTTAIRHLTLYGSLLLTCFSLYKEKSVKPVSLAFPLTIPVLLFLALIMAGMPFSLDRANTWHDIYAHFIYYMLLWFVIVVNVRDKSGFMLLMLAVVWGSAIFYSYCYVQQYILVADPLLQKQRFLIGVKYFTTSLIGIHLTFCVNVCLLQIFSTKKRVVKICYVLLIALFIFLVMASETRNAMLAILVSLLLLLILHRKKAIAVTVFVFFLVFLVFFPQSRRFHNNIINNERLPIYLMAIEVIKDYPLTGVGYGQSVYCTKVDDKAYMEKVKARYPHLQYYDIHFMHTHNLFLDIATRTGIPGLLAFLGILYQLLAIPIRCLRKRQAKQYPLAALLVATVCSLCVVGLFEQLCHHTYEALYALLFALTYFVWQSDTEANTRKNNVVLSNP